MRPSIHPGCGSSLGQPGKPASACSIKHGAWLPPANTTWCKAKTGERVSCNESDPRRERSWSFHPKRDQDLHLVRLLGLQAGGEPGAESAGNVFNGVGWHGGGGTWGQLRCPHFTVTFRGSVQWAVMLDWMPTQMAQGCPTGWKSFGEPPRGSCKSPRRSIGFGELDSEPVYKDRHSILELQSTARIGDRDLK